ncbi:WD40-repeat-containing domain protein [Aspergillus egyptiacus]|nr:WD40-repeat-containing domain protein [Aspergillus egyptiacus]
MAQNFQHPIQCIQFVKRKNGASKGVLVASVGAKLISYAAESGQRLADWPQDGADKSTANDAESNPETEGPPEKKRKVDTSSEKATCVASEKKSVTFTNIPILTSTPDGEYLVALTGEDKCIRVFQIEEDGLFQELSSRPMPKRPSAITFTDSNDILTSDKFGDVYSMPLIPSAEPRAPKAPRQEKIKKVAATPLTVHTQRNLKSLQMQLERAQKNPNENKDTDKPAFEYDLLLGHVSLLTDIAFVSISSRDPSSAQKRSYILSADRDEHIRVSRGPPQAHVIENYCLGHTSFISKLCVPPFAPEFLISGGGDPYLLVWNWTTGQIIHQIPLVKQTSEEKQVAVRGIWPALFGPRQFILVALDGSPTLQVFTIESNGSLTPHESLKANGNILDLQVREDINTLLLAVDCIREPGSTQEWRSTPSSPATFLEAFQLKGETESPQWDTVSDTMISTMNASGTIPVPEAGEKEKQALNNSLYSLENLRKKQLGVDE